ncbi:hypothetical protein SUGI_1199480 [Cryptomeria japonica]|nr:hypothetical protein SUGI_1199480 [Cryptomeria japonica]
MAFKFEDKMLLPLRTCKLCGIELSPTETLHIHAGKERNIDLGKARNLIALLDYIDCTTTTLFHPSLEDLRYETPAVDLLSSFGRSNGEIETETVE